MNQQNLRDLFIEEPDGELFHEIERIEAVSQEDIRRVANRIFVPKNRTIGRIETAAPSSAGQSIKGGEQ